MGVTARDLERLRRAMALGPKGRHRVEPNPMVGCVLARGDAVVGEGWHAAYGGPHAEVVALAAAGADARGATAYVSLEPCSRMAKTPPCAGALADAGVERVVFAAADPTEDGGGSRRLRERGIAVEGPVLEEEGARLLAPFLRALDRPRPWVALKWAMTLDGRIAEAEGRGGGITGEPARVLVHRLRAHADAVAVGVGTVLADDCRLTARLDDLDRPQPTRVVFDSTLRTPPTARLFADVSRAPVLLVAARGEGHRRRALQAAGAKVLVAPGHDGRVDLAVALAALRERGVGRLLVEGGARLNGALLDAGLVDQVSAFVAPRILGAAGAPGPVAGHGTLAGAARLTDVVWRSVGEDLLLEGGLVA